MRKRGAATIEILPADRLFVLTGAGISAESGIPTFRGKGGLWAGNRAEDLATPEAFERDPELVWRFYAMRRAHDGGCRANAAHRALAELKKKLGERMVLCTQNVDHLHEAAGAEDVLHMHGELFKSRCSNERCPTEPFEDAGRYEKLTEIPLCERCGALIRPHICWFGEMPFYIDELLRAAEECTVFLAVGTSGNVFPAASFAAMARRKGARAYYVGLEEPANAPAFQQMFLDKAGKVLPKLLGQE
jgi:NAD-dependent deacetylase